VGWQDLVLAGLNVVFLAALIPSLVNRATRISRTTSVPTAAAVWVQGAAFATLGLWWTAAGSFLIAVAWTFLAVFRPTR